MKTLKRILIGILAIIVLLVIVAFFLPSKAHVERSIVINTVPRIVFDQVNTLKNWEKWSPWHEKDPKMVIVYERPTAGSGAIYKWDSKNPEVGYGSLTITASDPNKSIAMMMDFMESGTATGKFKFEKVEGGTNVKWSMETDLGMNLIAKYFGLFMDKMVGPDFEKGLNKLKTVAESTPEIKIEATNIQEQPIISIRTTCNHKDIGQTLGQLYGELLGYMQKSGAQMTGAPLAIYYSYSLEKFDLEAALPVDKVAKPSGKIKSRLMNG